jgi:hypothetical protein
MKIPRRSDGTFAPLPLDKRFWSKVKKTNNCWVWLGGTTNKANPYGKFSSVYGQTSAHRMAYELTKGAISKGLEIDHLCKNTLCVNPDHLEAVTKQVNMLRRRNIFCLRGHSMAGNNLYISPKGVRGCRNCRKIAVNKYMENHLEDS